MNSLWLLLALIPLAMVIVLGIMLRRARRDLDRYRQTEEQTRLTVTAFENSKAATFITNRSGIIQQVNQAFTHLTGYTANEAVGQNPRLLKSGKHDAEFYAALWQSLLMEGHWAGEIWNRHKNGELYAMGIHHHGAYP